MTREKHLRTGNGIAINTAEGMPTAHIRVLRLESQLCSFLLTYTLRKQQMVVQVLFESLTPAGETQIVF